MRTHNICFLGEIRKISINLVGKKCLIWCHVKKTAGKHTQFYDNLDQLVSLRLCQIKMTMMMSWCFTPLSILFQSYWKKGMMNKGCLCNEELCSHEQSASNGHSLELPWFSLSNQNTWRPWSDAAFWGVWSGSALFANYPFTGLLITMG